jgi:hypothetical protein
LGADAHACILKERNIDGFVKRPSAALCFIRHSIYNELSAGFARLVSGAFPVLSSWMTSNEVVVIDTLRALNNSLKLTV